MGGFGSSSGFGSDTASSRGGSALGGSALGGIGTGVSSSSMGGIASSDARRSSHYDTEADPGHHYNSGELDTEAEVPPPPLLIHTKS
jgi:hypothetical protein